MLLDFFVLNGTNIFLASVLISIFKLNDKRLYFLLGTDLLLNTLPIITIIIIILYKFKVIIFSYIKESFGTRYLLIIIYYFIFGILIYGTYNGINAYIFKYLFNYLLINMLIYYLGIKLITDEYN